MKPSGNNTLIRRYSSRDKVVLVKKLATTMDPNNPSPRQSRSPSPVPESKGDGLGLALQSTGSAGKQGKPLPVAPSNPVSSSALRAARLYLARQADAEVV